MTLKISAQKVFVHPENFMRLIKNNVFLAIFYLLIVMHLFLLSTVRIYPFADLPWHLSAATIYRYSGESSNQFDEYYSINNVQPRYNS